MCFIVIFSNINVSEMNYESADEDYIVTAFVAQLGERKTEDLKVRGSIPRGGIFFINEIIIIMIHHFHIEKGISGNPSHQSSTI